MRMTFIFNRSERGTCLKINLSRSERSIKYAAPARKMTFSYFLSRFLAPVSFFIFLDINL